ncbi:hypothetical protein VTO58DRAFT_108696 [Aureobasidium pullulans]
MHIPLDRTFDDCLKGPCFKPLGPAPQFLFSFSSTPFAVKFIMCMRADCPKCKKVSWWGCGRHIPATMDKVPRDQRCTCGPPLEIDGKMYPPKPPGLFTDCSVS